jgi:uncharacterized protein (TIGR02996 family)
VNEREAFIRQICERPEDDTVRLVFADWLEEHGEPERAEFIRVQMEAERMRGGGCAVVLGAMCDGKKEWCVRCGLFRRALKLHNPHTDSWLPRILPGERSWSVSDEPPPETSHGPRYHWTRGFVSRIELPCDAFMQHAADIFAAHPVTEVRLTDCSPFRNGDGFWRWWWFNPDQDERARDADEVPDPLYNRVRGYYASAKIASDALCDAALAMARELAWTKGCEECGYPLAGPRCPVCEA